MKQPFVICIRNDDYPASLEKRKLYVKLPDEEAEKIQTVGEAVSFIKAKTGEN